MSSAHLTATETAVLETTTLRETVVVTDPAGFHLRPIVAFVTEAQQFPCEIAVLHGENRADGKSPMMLMMLAAEQGEVLVVEASGFESGLALKALLRVLIEHRAAEVAARR